MSGFDLDNNGKVELPGDAFGFGWWPGELGCCQFVEYYT
jgi:hypothetical protein